MMGRITSWNPATKRIFGWTAAEVIGDLAPYVPEERIEEFGTSVIGCCAVKRSVDEEAGGSGKMALPSLSVFSASPLKNIHGVSLAAPGLLPISASGGKIKMPCRTVGGTVFPESFTLLLLRWRSPGFRMGLSIEAE